jgi:peptide/nickel transport system permease protein
VLILRFIGRRVLQFVPVVLLATIVVFGLIQLIPGDIAITLAGENASAARIEEIRVLYGLDHSFIVRYWTWLTGVAQGNLSQSLLASKPVLDLIMERFPATLLVVAGAISLSLVVGVPLGVVAAVRARGPVDTVVMAMSSVGVALPNFWLAMILVYWLSLTWNLLPATGMPSIADDPGDAVRHAVLPAIALGASGVAEVARQVRSALVDVLTSDYVRTLRAKGLARWRVLWQHGLKNIGVTLLTVISLLINRLLGATVVVEAVFAIPGIGSLLVYSAINKDFAVIQGIALTLVLIVILVNLATDILYLAVDPRIGRRD